MNLRSIAALAGLALAAALAHPGAGAAAPHSSATEPSALAQDPYFTEQTIFAEGMNDYHCIRIPALVTAADGTLLAFAEGRVDDCGDHGDIDLILRRSTDGGQTWGPIQVVISGDGDTRGNPTPVLDESTGRIVLLSTWNAPGDSSDRRPYLSHSDDHGATWSDPVDISNAAKEPHWEGYATGPVHAIQLRHGEHAGRLVAGANHTWGSGRPEGFARGAHLLYSDDGGTTWEIGATDSVGDNTVNPQEVSVVELSDGTVYAAARDQYGTSDGTRAFALSSDGGQNFDARFASLPELSAPVVQAATLRLRTTADGQEHDRILISAPAHPASREAMTVRSSYDEGATWEHWNEGKVIHWGPSAYSDLVNLPEGHIGLAYEAGEGTTPYEVIRFAVFNEAFLATANDDPPGFPDPPDPGPTTPDASRQGNIAYLRGTPAVVDGPGERFGDALEFDGEAGHLQVPFTDAVDLDDDDFTLSMWFRYGDSSADQVLLWAYGIGSSKPSFWLRAEPGQDRIRALMTTEQGGASLVTDRAYDDGEWHHAIVRRGDGELRLSIDGEILDTVNDPGGSVTLGGDEFGIDGIYVGQRMDGDQHLHGAVDEVRIYRTALTQREQHLIREANAAVPRHLALRLSLNDTHPE